MIIFSSNVLKFLAFLMLFSLLSCAEEKKCETPLVNGWEGYSSYLYVESRKRVELSKRIMSELGSVKLIDCRFDDREVLNLLDALRYASNYYLEARPFSAEVATQYLFNENQDIVLSAATLLALSGSEEDMRVLVNLDESDPFYSVVKEAAMYVRSQEKRRKRK